MSSEEQTIRLASLERVGSYSAVSTWWNVVSDYYVSAKNSQNQTLASSVTLVERLTTPALRVVATVPSYCPEGVVETVDGVAVRQLEAAEALVARGTATVSDSTTYVRETKDAAVARGAEMYANSSSYVLSSKDAVVSRVSGSTANVVSTVVNEGHNRVVRTREYATSTVSDSTAYVRETIAPCTSRVAGWRSALRKQFGKEESADASENQEEGEKLSPFQRVATIFPGIVRFDGDIVARPVLYCVDGFKSRRDNVYQMFHQAQEASQSRIQATRDFIQPAISEPTKTAAKTATSLKETTRSYATFALTTQRNLLETIRDSVTSLEKTRGTNPDSKLLQQLDYVPTFVFSWTTKTIDFSDGVLAWTHNYVTPPKEEVAPVDE